MASAKGSALEWALALLRAPGERHALRQRPLPQGMHRLLGIAAGAMPQELADAARNFGEQEHVVREAAQFYAREVLFFPTADAYRTLGVAPDADHEQIKLHYRLLQHWLHPDRLQSEDDAVFAGRVNTAWNLLRNEGRRAAYDQAQTGAATGDSASASTVERPMPAWVQHAMPPEAARAHWMHRLPVLALGIACVALATLAIRDADRQPDVWRDRLARAAVPADAPLDIAVPGRPDIPPTTPAQSGPSARAVPRVAGAPVAETDGAAQRAPIAMAIDKVVSAVFPTTLPAEAVAPPAIAHAAVEGPGVPDPGPPPVPSRPVVSAQEPMRMPVVLPTPPKPSLVAVQAIAPLLPATVDASPPAPRAPVDPPSAARIRQAQQAGGLLLRYMGDAGRTSPPLWNSPTIQSSAGQLRRELQQQGRIRLAAPDWRIDHQSASLKAAYRVDGPIQQGGSISAELAWRDGQWLITGLSMERAP